MRLEGENKQQIIDHQGKHLSNLLKSNASHENSEIRRNELENELAFIVNEMDSIKNKHTQK